jgi:primase-polymerase (primpol)-like protein
MEVQAIALNPDILRQALKDPLKAFTAYTQFIVYKLAPSKNRPGKNEKFPVNYANPHGKYVNCLDSTFWTDQETAINAATKAGPEFGVGFVFTSQDPFWCLDIDDCLEPCGTRWSALAIELMAKLKGAAIEISSSRKGLHIFGKGIAPSHKCKNKTLKIELYTAAPANFIKTMNAYFLSVVICFEYL